MQQRLQHSRSFIALLIAVSIAFIWLLWPFYGAVFWGTILAVVFAPLHRRLARRLAPRGNLAAFISLLVVLLVAIIPLILITGSLIQEGAGLYQRMRSGSVDFGLYFQQVMNAMPPMVHSLLARFDLTELGSVQAKLSNGAMQLSQFMATQLLNVGQDTAQFLVSFGVMLYLLFFLLRDGPILSSRLLLALPLEEEYKRHLFRKFTTVVRATVKGNIAVAAIQGALGGVIFWVLGIQGALLWGVVMAFLSLLPAVGAGLIWLPVAIYFLVTGAIWQGVVLILFGMLVIGMVDNVLRPVLVGKDTKLPDYVILISTLGGMALFGLNGFVIGPLIAALFVACWDLFSQPAAGLQAADEPEEAPRCETCSEPRDSETM
ncbi:AI-2E family transporter [Bordetella avium]|uniref:Membrane protein n=1 Tax=Bordetella avium (strain 197N) TaxID=360910 RepID=Q2KZ87_BORA1|nr:AI-2E family transporter [Bordetella avium]AZY49447.1 AI-2E family transporter [Bordetella avium]AZY52845.1 AI-2E family transporter [Bordetella avium]RIQ12143.1 AI-2E family transporter [Bordetella avium]RIQ19037.1 AI-2E family transporter [Bordetella avium]RIQ31946.1 AI-2E family transporter [Bordetella avium]